MTRTFIHPCPCSTTVRREGRAPTTRATALRPARAAAGLAAWAAFCTFVLSGVPGATAQSAQSARTPVGTGVRSVVPQGERTLEPDADDIVVSIDPSVEIHDAVDLLLLQVEAIGTGRMTLRDGDVLSGRIVCEGLDIAPGATVFVEGDTEILALGDSVIDAVFAPAPWAFSDEFEAALPATADDAGAAADDLEEIEVAFAQGAPGGPMAPSCPAVTKQTGARGKRPPKVSITFSGNWTFLGLAAGTCGGPLPIQLPAPLSQVVVGARSAKSIGGAGGPGLDVTLRGIGNSTVTIAGDLCNGQGADGASAVAIGADGPPCECGGDAYAAGGKGGDAGNLTVTARHIVWDMVMASITVQPGGAGGAATAVAGNGGDCTICGEEGGRGGHAAALGGKTGKAGRITVKASQTMTPAPQAVLGSAIFSVTPSPDGGSATATAGAGGAGGDCVDCDADGGRGGKGGQAFARGADGAPGVLLVASLGGAITAYYGSDAGDGGTGDATAGEGGFGGEGGDCPCSVQVQAGNGGDGGEGGGATARGGDGGKAKGGKPALALNTPNAGNGGNAFATCGDGGWGGAGGWCILDTPENCTPGNGGAGGQGGGRKAVGGKGGTADSAAVAGAAGAPLPALVGVCFDGGPGPSGLSDCPRDPDTDGDCCVPGNAPGCNDPACTALICSNIPYCCEVTWDAICAEKAQQLCGVCNGGGGQGSCCIPHPGAGCDSLSCAGLVCSFNPLCCEVQWDLICASLAQEMCFECSES